LDLHGPYRPRPIRCQGIWGSGGWRLKVYGIAHGSEVPKPALIEALKATAPDVLPQPAITNRRYGVGFVCAHQGRTADVAFIDWWEDEDELHHRMFISDPGSQGQLRPARADELTACSWDLALIGFERDVWVETVLKNADGPGIDDYLQTRMSHDM
jgi:hypothetical protein